MKKIFYLCSLLALSLFNASCSDDDNPADSYVNAKIVTNSVENQKQITGNSATVVTMSVPQSALAEWNKLNWSVSALVSDSNTNKIPDSNRYVHVMTLKTDPTMEDHRLTGAPVKYSISNSNIELGMTFLAVNPDGNLPVDCTELSAGKIGLKTSNLSSIDLYLAYVATVVDSTTVIDTVKIDVKIGRHEYLIPIPAVSGAKYSSVSNELISNSINALFGKYTEYKTISTQIENLDKRCTAPAYIEQKIYTYRVIFGNETVEVKVYQTPDIIVDMSKAEEYDAQHLDDHSNDQPF